MSQPDADVFGLAGPIPTAPDVRRALRYLGRKGCHARQDEPADAAKGDYVVLGQRGERLAIIPAAIAAQARSRGWLYCDGEGRLHLSATGVKMLRRAASEPPSPTKRPKRAAAGKGRVQRSPAHAAPESPLAWLRRRKDKDGRTLITQAQYDAGERLAADYRRAQISRRVTSDWSGVAASRSARRSAPGAGVDLSDAATAARQRVQGALTAVGSELAGILIDVCCHETGLEAAERAEGWPQRAAKIVLQLALTALARHYGLIAPERPLSARLRHWGDENYRPGIEAWK